MKRITDNNQITVDVGKLSEGLALTFTGVTKVFESLGADEIPGFGTVSTVEVEKAEDVTDTADTTATTSITDKKTTKATSKKPAKGQNEPETGEDEPAGKTDAEGAEPAVEEADSTKETAQETTEAPVETSNDAPSEDTTAAVENSKGGSAFTVEDIMKIAAQKMTKDSSVTEKIGALVKTYGVATLKELPSDKLEAFMTDLTQI